jgi:hypothetical protein
MLLLYHEWAARPKGVSERYTMQQSVDVACATLSLPSFQVSPAHGMAFKNLQFAGGHYFDIGTGLLPFSITPADAQSSVARVMLAADQGRADAFDLGADPETSAIAPGDVPRLRNLQGYLPHGWIEAGSQLRSACGLLGALLGLVHPVVRAYLRFLTKYGRLQTRLSLELDHEFGAWLGPPLFNFHVQLAVINWLVMQMDSVESDTIDPPPLQQWAGDVRNLEQSHVGSLCDKCACPVVPSCGLPTPTTGGTSLGSSEGSGCA